MLYFVIWIGVAWLLNRWSAAQDRGEIAVHPGRFAPLPRGQRARAALYVLTMTFASVDWIMSLDPHWFSTIFGFILVAGQGLAAFALVIVVLAMLTRREPCATYLNAARTSTTSGSCCSRS